MRRSQLLNPAHPTDGKKGAGGDIPPHSTLCFTVELQKSHKKY